MSEDFNQQVAQREKQRAAKIAMFLQLVNDADCAPYVAILRNGHNEAKPSVTAKPAPAKKKEPFVPPAGFKTGNRIREAICALSLPHQFTPDDVLNGLAAAKFEFTGHDLKHSIRDALAVLSKGKNPVFKWVGGGQGGKPKIYERV